MTLPSSGAISFSQIRSEFGSVGNDGLSSYGALDSGIPASGATIKFSNFYNKILNATRTVSTNQTNYNARTDFQNATIVGGKKTTATVYSSNQTVKYYLTVDSGIVIGASDTANTAFVTGNWPGGSYFQLNNVGYIVGAGGAGAGDAGGAGGAGGNALNASYNLAINNTGTIAGGGGGGGAGSDGYANGCQQTGCCQQECYTATAVHGGGGGGAGFPAGTGGYNAGSSGSLTAGGAGGGGYCSSNGNQTACSTSGGSGGALGAVGSGSAGSGGAAGNYIVGNSYVTWLAYGSIAGGAS
jgi:hypothetical protein